MREVIYLSERMELKFEQRNKSILEKAEKLISKKGVANVTMQEIAESVGVAKGTLYLHYKSKEQLLFSLIVPKLHLLIEDLKEINDEMKSVNEQMEQAIIVMYRSDFFSFINQNYEYMHKLFNKEYSNELNDILDDILVIITQMIERGKKRGDFDTEIPTEFLAHQFLHLFDPQTYKSLVSTNHCNELDFINYTVNFYLNSLKK